MERIEQLVNELASAFCKLERHDKTLYINALHSLVALAVSEERRHRSNSIESDMKHVGRIFTDTQKVQTENEPQFSESRRKRDGRIIPR